MKYVSIVMISLILLACQKDPNVQVLLEKNDVIDTVTRLFIETDNRNWSEVQQIFADSVRFDMTSLTGGEPSWLPAKDITDAWDKGLGALKALHHQASNFRVTVDQTQAEVFCYGVALHYLPNPTGRNVRMFVGSYDFKLAKFENRWRITHFKFNSKFIDGNTDLEGSVK